MLTKRHRHQQGFSLTELAIVLGVMSTIVGAIWVAAANVNNNNKVQKATQEAAFILTNYRTLYAQHAVDAGTTAAPNDITCIGANAGFFPAETQTGAAGSCSEANGTTTYPQNPWGVASTGQYIVVYENQALQSIMIEFDGLPQSACISLATALMNASDVTYATINGTANGDGMAAYTAWTVSQITPKCNAAGMGNVIQVNYKAR